MPLNPGVARVDFEATPGDVFLVPGPIRVFGLSLSLALDGLDQIGLAPSNFRPQHAVVVCAEREAPSITYTWQRIDPDDGSWLWTPPDHPLARASPELTQQMRCLTEGLSARQAEGAVLNHVASVFRYGHGDARFTDGADAVPALSCGLTRGSCVDIHTYAVAALRAVGLRAAYVAGVFWPERVKTAHDMHCWIATEDADRAWDISHDIMSGRDPSPNFDARPGTRLPFSIGRGQRFIWQGEVTEISHFALPHRLTPDGAEEITSALTRLI